MEHTIFFFTGTGNSPNVALEIASVEAASVLSTAKSMKHVNGANKKENKRILLVDAPASLGWEAWRKIDQENSMSVLQKHIEDLKVKGYLCDSVDTQLMTTLFPELSMIWH